MIVLQIICLLFILLLTLLLPFVINIYVNKLIYCIPLGLLFITYSCLFAYISSNMEFAMLIFINLFMVYIIKIINFKFFSKKKIKNILKK